MLLCLLVYMTLYWIWIYSTHWRAEIFLHVYHNQGWPDRTICCHFELERYGSRELVMEIMVRIMEGFEIFWEW